jgi:branched-chain amino acid transport system substrate-binding protein
MLRVGILLPRSTLFPSLGLDILDGIKQYLKYQNIFEDIKFLIENIGFGIEEPEIYSKAEKLVLQEDVDMVIVCADTVISEMLQPLFTASNKILLVVNFGANLPQNWQTAPTTITHSLNFCWHTRLTGKLAAATSANKKVINIMSYYDSGYRQAYSMMMGNQEFGGEPLFNHVTHLKDNEFTLEPIATFLQKNDDVKKVLCLFTDIQAALFYKEILPLQQQHSLHLFVSPMMFDESLKPQLGDDIVLKNIKGYLPWHPSLNNENNTIFKEYYKSATNKIANYFSLLGWEAGMLVEQIFKQKNADNNTAAAIVKSISQFILPRGWLKVDAATNLTYGASYLANCSNNFDITLSNEVDNLEEEWTEFVNQRIPKEESSGWRNTYLCI